MPKVSPGQLNFNGGEFSPLLYGRVDSDRYKTALRICKNYLPTIQGGLTRRPGTVYVSNTKEPDQFSRLQPFEFSTTQAYMLEFGNEYIRFFKDNGIITFPEIVITGATQTNPVVITANAHGFSDGDRVIITNVGGMTQLDNREFVVDNSTANTFELLGVNGTAFDAYTSGGTVAQIVEVVSTYQEADLRQLQFTQSADVLYIVHPDYEPRKLTRTSHTAWTLTVIDFSDGPYFSTNTTDTTLAPAAATGTGILVTANSTVGINDGAGFKTTDVGRFIRMKEGSTWGWAIIVSYVNPGQVTVDIQASFVNANAKLAWRLGLWSETTGYPGTVTFHEDRLFFGGSKGAPQRLDGSRSGDYENFAPTDTDGTITNSHSVGFSLNSNDVNAIRWATSDEKGMLVGTVGGEWVVRASSLNEALSPTNIGAKKATSYGSQDVQPVQIGKSTIFVQRSGRLIRELNYYYDVDGFRASDLTQLAEHITQTGIVQMAAQKSPQQFVWCVRNDGQLACMTYDRDLDALKVGWHRHILGGTSDAGGSDATVESVGVIESADGERQDLWIIVKRFINGAIVRHIEYLTKIFDDEDEQRDAHFLDAGLEYDNPLAISAITVANPAVVTVTAHGLLNGDKILINDVAGMDVDGESQLNSNTYFVRNKTPNTFQLEDVHSNIVNSSTFNPYIEGGFVRKLISTLSGLNHLEGQTIDILGDGAVQPSKTVVKGKITLSDMAATVHIGYGYQSDGSLLRIEAGSADGAALGKTRRTHRVGILLHRSLGLELGPDFDRLSTITFRTAADHLTRAPALFSGIISENFEAGYDFENYICWRQAQPLPSMVLAILPQLVTQDRG